MNAPVTIPVPSSTDRFHQRFFDAVYSRSLLYNTCWEDPAIDRLALRLGHDDTLMLITSAGCNTLDYALLAPKKFTQLMPIRDKPLYWKLNKRAFAT